MIALVVPEISNYFFGQLAKGAEDAASARDYGLLLCNSHGEASRDHRFFDLLRNRTVDGLVYVAARDAVGHDELLRTARDHAIVLADELVDGLVDVPFVTSDNRAGGTLAAAHLRDLGHRNCVVIAGPRGLRSVEDRIAGFLEGMPDSRIVDGDFTHEAGFARTSALIAEGATFSAVFALNDLMAIGAMDALTAAGRSVPSDVSVIGFDDISSAALVTPALTTIRQPALELGREAVDALLDSLTDPLGEGARGPVREVLPVRLIVRGSTAPSSARISARTPAPTAAATATATAPTERP